MKTYFHEGDINSYVYELYSPVSAQEFFSHPIFNVVLYNNVCKVTKYDTVCYNVEQKKEYIFLKEKGR